ncbi:MAG TPA: S8 family peptidase [Polyangiaceae bacterium]|jgi:serine protease
MRIRSFAGAGLALLLSASASKDALALDPPPTFGRDPGAEADVVPGEIAVDVRDDASDAAIADLAAAQGIALRPNSDWSAAHDKMEVADVDPAREAAVLEALSRDPRVESAEPMAIYRASFVPNDPLYASKQWHLQRVGAESAWHYSCGRGVTVAVIDTGVACFDEGPFARGSDLAGTRCEGGYNFVERSAPPHDDHGHGTHVAGTIAQTTHNGVGTAGLAYCATLMPIKVLSKHGFGTVASIAEGIRFAADEGAQIVNLSLGGPIRSRVLESAVEHAIAKGVIVVAAAGNSGREVGYPAAYPGVIAVSATDPADALAWFSSRGPEITIAAPGVAVTQQTICNGGRDHCEIFGTFNGTSMASPHVAGVAAMVEALGVTDAASVRSALTQTARTPAAGADKQLFGAGIVDARAAVMRAFWSRLALRLAALGFLAWAVARRIRRRGGKTAWTPGAIVGAMWAATGLAPWAPLVGLSPGTSGAGRWVELAMRPLGEWDLSLLGAGAHAWLLFASALPAFALASIAFAQPRARPFIGGLALGSAALLTQMAAAGDVAFVGGSFLLRVFALANVGACLWLGRISLEVRSPR